MEKAKKNVTKKKTTTVSRKKTSVIKGNEIFEDLQPNKKKHISFGFRVGVFAFLFCAFLFVAVFLIISTLTIQKEKYINYNERSQLDYRVNLKPNDYYDSPYLGKNMMYIASLIKSIDAIYNYNFEIDENVNIDFGYDVTAELRITDESEGNLFLKKDYVLLSGKKISIENGKHANISETVNIDYSYYNAIANGFKAAYGINSKSTLLVTLTIHKINKDEKTEIYSNTSTQQIKIPLSERAINIKLDYTDIDSKSVIVSEKELQISNLYMMAGGAVSLIISIFFALKMVKLLEVTSVKPNDFDKYVSKVLKTYDRLIVESRNAIKFDDYQTIKVNSFEELLDVRDNLKLPINYYVITPHQKACFYIISTNIYMFTVKEVDLKKK